MFLVGDTLNSIKHNLYLTTPRFNILCGIYLVSLLWSLFMMVRILLIFLGLYLSLTPSFGLEKIRGEATQGGLIILKASSGSSLTLDDTMVMTTKDGYAAVGFHRDDTAAITIVETRPDGSKERLILTPRARVYNEQRISGLPSAMVTPPDDVLMRIKRDRKAVAVARGQTTMNEAFSKPFIWPVHGIITGVYGSKRVLNDEPRAPHYGIDIAAAKGTPIRAPQDGIISMVDDLYFTGITIILDHGHGVSSTFLHLEAASVAVGDLVKQGQIIGTVGSTGRSTAPHLDWRVNLFKKRLDPALLAGAMPE
jgi:hypothetical protein